MRGSRAYLPFEAAERSLPVSASSFVPMLIVVTLKVIMALSPLRFLVVALVLALGAVRASGARYAPAVSSRIVLNQTWLPHLLGSEPRVPRPNCTQVGAMPPAINMDIKVSFELFDMTPGPKGRRFMQNLLLHGGSFVDDTAASRTPTATVDRGH
jgi:hypothetical protein